MSFSQAEVGDVRLSLDGADLLVSWSGTLAPSLVYQVYVDRLLVWYGVESRCFVPYPGEAAGGQVWVEVGVVAASEATTDYSSSLTTTIARAGRVELGWFGGTYLDTTGQDDVVGFQIFQSESPGGSVSFASPVGQVAAYPGGWVNDGFGKGGYGDAGFGRAATWYRWTSRPLSSGVWSFAIVPFDGAGVLASSPSTVQVTVAAAPGPPAEDSAGRRLVLSYGATSGSSLTLNWLASPSE